MYAWPMDVSVTELRAHLKHYLDLAREGEPIVITDRGLPIARLSGLDSTSLIEKLTAEGVISKPRQPRRAMGEYGDRVRLRTGALASDYVSAQRR